MCCVKDSSIYIYIEELTLPGLRERKREREGGGIRGREREKRNKMEGEVRRKREGEVSRDRMQPSPQAKSEQ